MPTTASTSPTRIDVLIPAFNVASTVREAVNSILQQTIKDIRVVIVNDGSTDDTALELARLADSDSRIIVLHQANGGIVDALNNGLKVCTSEFIARHDGDDIAYSDRLEKQLAYMDANPDCIAVGGNARHIDSAGRLLGTFAHMKDPAHADANRFPAHEPYLMHPILFIRRDVLMSIGAYRHVFHAEDADLYWRLRNIGRLHNLPDYMADYRIHADSISGRSVVNGRVQAVNSQLAALSEKRRHRGAADLTFPKARLARLHNAASIHHMMAVAEEELSGTEREHFRLAVAAKLLELVSYRPYRLDRDDRVFIKSALVRYGNLLDAYNLHELKQRQAKYIVTLISQKNFNAAVDLIRPSIGMPIAVLLSKWAGRKALRLIKR